jgi:electron transfer flavoprotein beta subunit
MGAKSKPQETLALDELGVEAGAKTEVLALADPPPRGETRKLEDDGNAAAQIVQFLEERRLI